MSKVLLKQTERQFVDWSITQPNDVWFQFATTPMNGRTEIARFRRSFLKTLNNINHRRLRGRL